MTILLLAVCAEMLISPILLSDNHQLTRNIFVHLFYLGSAHQGVSFALLLAVPEVKAWMKEQGGGQIWRFWAKALSIGMFILVATEYFILRGPQSPHFLLGAFLILRSGWGLYHMIQQMKGLSLQYSRQAPRYADLSAAARLRMQRLQTWERYTFSALTASVLLTDILFIRFIFGPLQHLAWVWAGVGSSIFLTGALFLLARSCPTAKHTYKSAYLIRTALLPFVSVSLISNLCLRLIHGGEYMLLMTRVHRQSKDPRHVFLFLSILFSAAVIFLDWARPGHLGQVFGLASLGGLVALSVTLEFCHYLSDARMFRFKDKAARTHISPLVF